MTDSCFFGGNKGEDVKVGVCVTAEGEKKHLGLFSSCGKNGFDPDRLYVHACFGETTKADKSKSTRADGEAFSVFFDWAY